MPPLYTVVLMPTVHVLQVVEMMSVAQPVIVIIKQVCVSRGGGEAFTLHLTLLFPA